LVIELLIAEHLIEVELLIEEDIVKRLVEESLVVEYSVTVERNGWPKIVGIR
jgi:hypothetical protein